jgi:FAD/FMN-containing dehydrogenase
MADVTDPLTLALADIVGAEHVLTDPDLTAAFGTDWTGRWRGAPRCVVRPASEDEVAAVVQACAAAGVAIVTQGGNTGLVGGGVPRSGEVVLSTRRLAETGAVDAAAMQVTAGAGVTIEQWHDIAHQSGLDAGVDWGARSSATVGGAIATNAGGSRVVRFGTMRSQVLGIRAVLADGSVIGSLSGLPKETLGMHLPSILCGSEGTLGVITAARLRLVPWYRHTAAAWVGLGSVDEAVRLLAAARSLDGLDAAEILFTPAVQLTAAHLATSVPTWPGCSIYVLLDVARHQDPTDDLAAFLADVASPECAVIAVDEQRRRLLRLRDSVSVAISAEGVPLKLDVAVPIGELDELVTQSDTVVRSLAPEVRSIIFGHLAEGNLHVNLLDVDEPRRDALTDAILDIVIALGGTISAEHGVGVAKTAWLERARGAADVHALAAIKRALDPQDLLNPGVLLPSTS